MRWLSRLAQPADVRQLERELTKARGELDALRLRYAELERETVGLREQVQHQLADIRVGEAENTRLWEMDQRFLARVRTEIALAHRAKADAEVLASSDTDA